MNANIALVAAVEEEAFDAAERAKAALALQEEAARKEKEEEQRQELEIKAAATVEMLMLAQDRADAVIAVIRSKLRGKHDPSSITSADATYIWNMAAMNTAVRTAAKVALAPEYRAQSSPLDLATAAEIAKILGSMTEKASG